MTKTLTLLAATTALSAAIGAPAGSVASPENGLFGNGAGPRTPMN